MSDQDRLPVTLQRHHVAIVETQLKGFEGDPTIISRQYSQTVADLGLGYATDPDQLKELQDGIRLAFEAVATGKFSTIPDGRPDTICMGCFRPDCGITLQRRDTHRARWKAMRRQIHGW